MLFVSILHHYLLWHYTKALGEILHVWSNLFWFTINFFSITQLLRSFFSPWKRMTEDRGNTFNMEDLAAFVVIGLISRIIGMILRTVVISMGMVALCILLVGIIVTYMFWLLAPGMIVACMYFGLHLMFT